MLHCHIRSPQLFVAPAFCGISIRISKECYSAALSLVWMLYISIRYSAIFIPIFVIAFMHILFLPSSLSTFLQLYFLFILLSLLLSSAFFSFFFFASFLPSFQFYNFLFSFLSFLPYLSFSLS